MARASSACAFPANRRPGRQQHQSHRRLRRRHRQSATAPPSSQAGRPAAAGVQTMDKPGQTLLRCAIYTRKSTEHNLDLEFNSLDAQREACEAYIKSQAHEGWRLINGHYDDGAFSGASLDRPALKELLAEVLAGKAGV